MKLLKISLAALLLGAPASAQQPYLFFGDSLVDSSNSFSFTERIFGAENAIPASPPYFNGRFSNGPNWTDVLAPGQSSYFAYFFSDPACDGGGIFPDSLCDPALDPGPQQGNSVNFAFGGARSEADVLPSAPGFLTIVGDVEGYVAAGRLARPEDHTLALWVGGNDASAYTVAVIGGTTEQSIADFAAGVVDNIEQGLGRLAALGPNRALVFTLEDLSRVPTFVDVFGAENAALAGRAGQAINTELLARLSAIEASSGLEIIPIDTAQLYEEIFAEPALFGFTNLTQGCITQGDNTPTGACPDAAAEAATVYWDGTHPTTAMHSYVAELVDSTVQIVDQDAARLAAAPDSNLVQAGLVTAALREHIASRRAFGGEGNAGFAVAFNQFGERGSRTGFSGYDFHAVGVIAGLDTSIGGGSEPVLAGFFLGYSDLDADMNGGGDVDSRAIAFGGYAAGRLDRAQLSLSLTGLRFDLDNIIRPTGFSVLPTARGETDGWGFVGELELGMPLIIDGLELTPYARLAGAVTSLNAYNEQGARLLNLAVDDSDVSGLDLGAGLRIAVREPSAGLSPYVTLGYTRSVLDARREISAALSSGLTASTSADADIRNRLDIKAGLGWTPTADLVIGLSFAAGFAPGEDDRFYTAPRLSLMTRF